MMWESFRPAAWIVLIMAVILLALAGMVSQGWTKIIVPPPENTAEQLVSALAAHRYAGAMNQLSQELQQQIHPEDLASLVKSIEHSPAKGIQDAHGLAAQELAAQKLVDQATADVRVKLGNNEAVDVRFPLIKEKGVWKVSSLDPLKQLAGE
jgi:hypothetical protein